MPLFAIQGNICSKHSSVWTCSCYSDSLKQISSILCSPENFFPQILALIWCAVSCLLCCCLSVNNWDNLKKIGHLLPFIYRLSPSWSRLATQRRPRHLNIFLFSFHLPDTSQNDFFFCRFFSLTLSLCEFYVSGLETFCLKLDIQSSSTIMFKLCMVQLRIIEMWAICWRNVKESNKANITDS